MPTLDQATRHLRELASRPPSSPTPVASICERAIRLRRRRRTGRAVGLVVAVGIVLFASIATRDSEPPAVSGSTTSTSELPVTLIVTPSEDLRPNQVVTITLPDGADDSDLIVAQCGREAARSAPESWCQVTSTGGTPGASREIQLNVRRVIQTTNGRIDCAERRQRCVIGVRSGGRDHVAPISFDSDLPALDPALDVIDQSEQVLTVQGTGYEPGSSVVLAQCRPTPDQQVSTSRVFGSCDQLRAPRVTADDDGGFTAEVPLYREIFDHTTGWGPCEPCQVQALTAAVDTRVVEADSTKGFGGRPSVEIVPAGPYAAGQLVELHGSGFAPDMSLLGVTIAWCQFRSDDPTTEPQGAGPEHADCSYPGTNLDLTTSDTGSFTISDFPMPDSRWGANQVACRDPAASCALAWHPGEGAVPYFLTEFTLR